MIRILSLALCAGPACADCPTSADLDGGIRAEISDGSYEVFTKLRAGVVEARNIYPDGFQSRTLLGQGVYLLETVNIYDGTPDALSRTNYAYAMNPDEMALPKAGSQWSVETSVRDFDGVYKEVQNHVWGKPTQVQYGKCSYTMIPGEFDYRFDDYSFQEVIHYLPELGIGLLYSLDNETAEGSDISEYLSFTAVGG